MDMQQLFVVVARTGDGCAARQRNVIAYRDEQLALEHARRAQELCPDHATFASASPAQLAQLSALDSHLHVEPGGVRYDVEPVALGSFLVPDTGAHLPARIFELQVDSDRTLRLERDRQGTQIHGVRGGDIGLYDTCELARVLRTRSGRAFGRHHGNLVVKVAASDRAGLSELRLQTVTGALRMSYLVPSRALERAGAALAGLPEMR